MVLLVQCFLLFCNIHDNTTTRVFTIGYSVVADEGCFRFGRARRRVKTLLGEVVKHKTPMSLVTFSAR